MPASGAEQRLSHITTLWSVVDRAHSPASEPLSDAQRVLIERYGGAVHRYLLGALRDRDAADDLFQEFSLRFLRGDFRNAHPQRGRFRDYVKTAVFHLIVDYQKRQKRMPRPLTPEIHEPAVIDPPVTASEHDLMAAWREQLMDRTWIALAGFEQRTGQPYSTILVLRTDQPTLSSAELAERVGAKLGKTYRVDAIRQALRRAREKFADLLLDEIVQSLEQPSVERLAEELADLGLLAYCRSALKRRSDM